MDLLDLFFYFFGKMSDLSYEDAFKMAINLIENSFPTKDDVSLFIRLIIEYPKITTMYIERIQVEDEELEAEGDESQQDNAGYTLFSYLTYFADDIDLEEDYVLQILELLLKINDKYVARLSEAEKNITIKSYNRHNLVNRIADDGQTPLGLALERRCYRIVKFLLLNCACTMSVGDEHDPEAIDGFNTDFEGLDHDVCDNFNIGMSECLDYIGLDESLEMENYDKIIRTCFVMRLLGEHGFHDYGVAEDLFEY